MSELPLEDEYVFHFTKQIIEYFETLGFEVTPIPISKKIEKQEGYDWRYEIRNLNKVFMLQFKRPNPRDKKISWELKEEQHKVLKKKKYIFYCLPKSRERSEMPVILYNSLFKAANFEFKKILTPRDIGFYDGWGSFASKVLNCVYGKKIIEDDKDELEIFEGVEIDLEESIVVGLSLEPKKMKIIVSDKLKEELDKKK